jgi:hypothetical protein
MDEKELDPKEWQQRIKYYSDYVRGIVIPRDLNPGTARNIISRMSAILLDVTQDYHKLKSTLNGIDTMISIIEKKNLTGTNAEARKKSAVEAVEKVAMDDGSTINLYQERKTYASLVSGIESIKEVLAAQQNLLVSMNGFMKLEEKVTPSNEV